MKPPNFEHSNYENIVKFKSNLIFISKKKNIESFDNFIPCSFYRKSNNPNLLIYFHGNSEHIFEVECYGLDFVSYLEMNVLLVEYPRYSIYG